MMLFNVDFESGEINILSIPRDTKIEINNKIAKINSAHKIGGMTLTLSAINDILETDIEHYVKVDYQVVMDIVDKIGGVEIDVPFLMQYNDPTTDPPLNIYIEKGFQVLDGKKAHDFIRWRKSNSMSVQYADGDLGRIRTQQYFMTELIKQTLRAENITKLPSIAIAYFNNVETNLPLNTILNGIKLAGNLDVENVKAYTLPGEDLYIDNISYYIQDKVHTKALLEELINY